MAKKREDRSKTGAEGAFDSPFAGLAGMRSALPGGAPEAELSEERAGTGASRVIVRRERAGRGGKTVTVIEGIEAERREEIARAMKRALGCGAGVEDERVVLQGAQEERAQAWLEKHGFSKVIRGT